MRIDISRHGLPDAKGWWPAARRASVTGWTAALGRIAALAQPTDRIYIREVSGWVVVDIIP